MVGVRVAKGAVTRDYSGIKSQGGQGCRARRNVSVGVV